MIAAVQDANVLIDLLSAGLLAPSLRLGLEFHVSDAVAAEILDPAQASALQSAVSAGWIAVDALPPATAALALSLQASEPRISLPDALSLLLAESLGGILLTGDRPLRELATARRTPAHGVLWILDRLVAENILVPPDAAAALRAMLAAGARLPRDDCHTRLLSWTPAKKSPQGD